MINICYKQFLRSEQHRVRRLECPMDRTVDMVNCFKPDTLKQNSKGVCVSGILQTPSFQTSQPIK